MRRAARIDGFETFVAADAVVGVDDEVAFRQRRGVGDEVLRLARLLAARLGEAVAEDVLFGDHAQAGGAEAAFERHHHHRQRDHRQGFHLGPGFGGLDACRAVVAQHRRKSVARAQGQRRDHHPPPLGPLFGDIGHDFREHSVEAARAHLGERAPRQAVHRADGRIGIVFGRGVEAGEQNRRVDRDVATPFRVVEIKARGRHRMVGSAAVPQARGLRRLARDVVFVDLVPRGFQAFVQARVEHDGGFRRVGEQRVHAVGKQRQPMLHPHEAPTGGNRLVERIVGDRAEKLAVAGAELGNARLVEADLADRAQHQAFERATGALRHRVEGAQRVEGVAEEVEARRIGCTGGEDVDDAAAHRVFARLQHLLGTAVAVAFEERNQVRRVDRRTADEVEMRARHGLAQRHPLHRRARRGEDQAALAHRFVGEARQGFQPPPDDFGMRRGAVVGYRIPGGEFEDFDVGREEADRFGETRELHVIRRDMQHAAGRGARKIAQNRRIVSRRDPGQGQPRAGVKLFNGCCQRNVLTYSKSISCRITGESIAAGTGALRQSQSRRSLSGTSRIASYSRSAGPSKPFKWADANAPITKSSSFMPR